ncbi:hypothetical protein ACIGW7_31000 [Streptomyces sp. NPDC053253]|uniref:hypothetical protein n=1 Tax=Streptomyces sp. NPDC053253 TaxID=3365699 RepID=UPI0037CFD8AE
MSGIEWRDRAPRHPRELQSIHELLDEVRIRPSMWVRGSSLRHLDSMLLGYRVGAEVHGARDGEDFAHTGLFSYWLWKRFDVDPNPLGWAVEIERAAEREGTPPMEMFFALLDDFRAERDAEAVR